MKKSTMMLLTLMSVMMFSCKDIRLIRSQRSETR